MSVREPHQPGPSGQSPQRSFDKVVAEAREEIARWPEGMKRLNAYRRQCVREMDEREYGKTVRAGQKQIHGRREGKRPFEYHPASGECGERCPFARTFCTLPLGHAGLFHDAGEGKLRGVAVWPRMTTGE